MHRALLLLLLPSLAAADRLTMKRVEGELGESPAWLLGKTACLQSLGGHLGRFSITRCAP